MRKKLLLIVLIALALIQTIHIALMFSTSFNTSPDYEATEYMLSSPYCEIKLTVYSDTTLGGYYKDESMTMNIRVYYENYGGGEYPYTAKIFNNDTNEYIDYVTIECDGNELKLISKILDASDPPNV